MKNRININNAEPAAYKAMLVFDSYLQQTEIEPLHKELIKIRASQINGCAYCLDMHTHDARKLGETEQRIYTLNAWRDTELFDEKEQAILALTEEVTLINRHVSDETVKAKVILGEKLLSQVIMAIIIINSWNRIAITSGLQPALRKA